MLLNHVFGTFDCMLIAILFVCLEKSADISYQFRLQKVNNKKEKSAKKCKNPEIEIN